MTLENATLRKSLTLRVGPDPADRMRVSENDSLGTCFHGFAKAMCCQNPWNFRRFMVLLPCIICKPPFGCLMRCPMGRLWIPDISTHHACGRCAVKPRGAGGSRALNITTSMAFSTGWVSIRQPAATKFDSEESGISFYIFLMVFALLSGCCRTKMAFEI